MKNLKTTVKALEKKIPKEKNNEFKEIIFTPKVIGEVIVEMLLL